MKMNSMKKILDIKNNHEKEMEKMKSEENKNSRKHQIEIENIRNNHAFAMENKRIEQQKLK